MSFNKVSAGNGLQWISSAINLLMKNPATFVVMALITAVIGFLAIIPFLGAIAVALISPALYGGYIFAAHKQFNGEQAQIGDVFAAFNQPDKLKPMLMLGIPTVAAAVVSLLLTMLGIAGALTSATAGGMGGVFVSLALAAVISAVAYAIIFFAIPRVMLDHVEPIQAMKDSVAAVLGNIPAVLVFGLLYFAASIILTLIPVLGWIVLLLVGQPIIGLSLYFAYRDVFGLGNTATVTLSDPPQPPLTVV